MTRLTAFAIVAITWMTWLIAGFTAGGMVVVIERLVTLIRTSDGYRRLKARLLTRALALPR
jgi:hypothetical protein